ncbi:HAD family hydrolase [Pacificoceanicola onchidii]|uniref:HAD family hydrolase n=1 Tax=Pacificoceanicola onchidii TaxID=2562685 RepID=UPI0010A640C3|nr:HAD-IA family hydrolase [Pacificoceanicola onchidii]
MQPDLIVWDFDGVLNANMRDGRIFWADDMKADLGIDPSVFTHDMFTAGDFKAIIRGRVDLLEHVSDWLARNDFAISGAAFLRYWFEKDAHPDAWMLGHIEAHPARHVIGTNNEHHRCAYIEDEMGYADHVERVFSSGRMGAAKPDAGFFAQIERWAGLAPSRILLVDDVAANIAAATARGWQGFHFTDQTRDGLPERLGLA